MDTYRSGQSLEVELPLTQREGDGLEIESSTESSGSENPSWSSQISLVTRPARLSDSHFTLESFSSNGDEDTGLLEDRDGDKGARYWGSSLLPWSSFSSPSLPIPSHTRPAELSLSQFRLSPEGQSSSSSSTSSTPPPPSPLVAD